jgi:predicted NBD/HSP70 family sugar kinase
MDARSPRQARSHGQVLEIVRDRGQVTRIELGRLTGLSRSAVTEVVRGLLHDGLVREERIPPHTIGRRGRPSSLLSPARPPGFVVGIDFGHAHVAVALADTAGTIQASRRRAVDVDGAAVRALDLAGSLTRELLADAGVAPGDLMAISAGIPGPIDRATALVRSPTILASWVDLDPSAELTARIGAPVRVGNDADMGAQGELHYGAARGYRDFMYVKASTGIGAGLVFGGQTYRGSLGIAGEIGHTQLPEAGNWCRCGNRGCLETVVSITQVEAQIAPLGLAPDPQECLAAAAAHPVAARIIREAGRTIGRVLADLCNCLNPEAIILGGELGTAGEPFVAGVTESIDRYAQPATAKAVAVRAAQLGLHAELRGAIAHAIDYALALPAGAATD